MSVDSVRHQSHTGLQCYLSRRFFAEEDPEIMAFPVHRGMSDPFLIGFVPVHPSVLRCRSTAISTVLAVPARPHGSQIGSTVVQFDAITMVPLPSVATAEAEQLAVQRNRVSRPRRAVRRNGIPVFVEVPAPLVHPRCVGGINNGMRDDGAIFGAKGDTNGILRLHRTSFRCHPPDATNVAGAYCVNYTNLSEWQAWVTRVTASGAA